VRLRLRFGGRSEKILRRIRRALLGAQSVELARRVVAPRANRWRRHRGARRDGTRAQDRRERRGGHGAHSANRRRGRSGAPFVVVAAHDEIHAQACRAARLRLPPASRRWPARGSRGARPETAAEPIFSAPAPQNTRLKMGGKLPLKDKRTSASAARTLADHGISADQSSKWQQLALAMRTPHAIVRGERQRRAAAGQNYRSLTLTRDHGTARGQAARAAAVLSPCPRTATRANR